jgi:hypothetical protein
VVGGFGDGGAGAGFIDDGFVVGAGGEQGGEAEVVDGAGFAAAVGVDEGDGVVAEEGVAASGDGEVVADVAGGFVSGHAGHVVTDADALVESGEDAEAHFDGEVGLAEQDGGERGAGIEAVICQEADRFQPAVGVQVRLVDLCRRRHRSTYAEPATMPTGWSGRAGFPYGGGLLGEADVVAVGIVAGSDGSSSCRDGCPRRGG